MNFMNRNETVDLSKSENEIAINNIFTLSPSIIRTKKITRTLLILGLGGIVTPSMADVTTVNFNNGGGSTFRLSTSNFVSTGTVTNGGTFEVNNYTHTGTLNNSGSMTINGDFVYSGNFIIGVTSSTDYGQIQVAGTATLASDVTLEVDVKSEDAVANGNVLTKVLSATTLVNNAGTFTVKDDSALFDFEATVNGNQIDITTVAAGTTGTTSSVGKVEGYVNSSGLTSGKGAAKVLDTFVQGGTTNSDFDNIVTALGKLTTQQQVSSAVAETLPVLVGGTEAVGISSMRGISNVVQSRQASVQGLSSGDSFLTNKGAWMKAIGSSSSQSDVNGVAGFDSIASGLVGGFDRDTSQTSRLGFALSYMNNDVDGTSTSSSNNASIDAYQVMVYGSSDFKKYKNTMLNWQAALGTNQTESTRSINFVNRTASADYTSLTAYVGAGLSKPFLLNEKTTITPSIRADYSYITSESYSETGANALNLKVEAVDAGSLIVMAKTDFNRKQSDSVSLYAGVGIGYDLLNDETSVTSSYSGGGASFTTTGLEVSPLLAEVGLGVIVALNDSSELTASYTVEGREDFLSQAVSLKARYDF